MCPLFQLSVIIAKGMWCTKLFACIRIIRYEYALSVKGKQRVPDFSSKRRQHIVKIKRRKNLLIIGRWMFYSDNIRNTRNSNELVFVRCSMQRALCLHSTVLFAIFCCINGKSVENYLSYWMYNNSNVLFARLHLEIYEIRNCLSNTIFQLFLNSNSYAVNVCDSDDFTVRVNPTCGQLT